MSVWGDKTRRILMCSDKKDIENLQNIELEI